MKKFSIEELDTTRSILKKYKIKYERILGPPDARYMQASRNTGSMMAPALIGLLTGVGVAAAMLLLRRMPC